MKQLKYKPIWVAFFTLTIYNCVGTNEKYTKAIRGGINTLP